jgi:hypothetical protein
MAAIELDEATLKETVKAYNQHNGSIRASSKALKISRSTMRRRLKRAAVVGLMPPHQPEFTRDDKFYYQAKIAQLSKELNQIKKHNITTEEVRKQIYGIAGLDAQVPDWVLRPRSVGQTISVPTATLSDTHWSEIVNPQQVMGVNSFNMTIGRKRIQNWVDRVIDLLINHINNPNYPGLILALLGDMVSGTIHEELAKTNEVPILASVQDVFGRVFIPCVPGNHGRLGKKVPSKNYAWENWDWHLYCILEKHFENDDRIQFLVSDGEDLQYKVYSWTYRITHGAQFRGGDGIIGPLGPIFRGDTKKRAQARDAGLEYDILVLGHFHRIMMLRRVMANGAIKGFDEYAMKNNFPYEPPQQALWVTHPKWGITFQFAVRADEAASREDRGDWVSWQNLKEM